MDPFWSVVLIVAAVVVTVALFYFVCRRLFILRCFYRGNWYARNGIKFIGSLGHYPH